MRFRTLQAAPLIQLPAFLIIMTAPVYVPRDLIEGWVASVASVNPMTAMLEAGPQPDHRRPGRDAARARRRRRADRGDDQLGAHRAAPGRGGGVTRTVYYCAATLDGYIAEADDTIDWLTSYDGRAGDEVDPVEGGYDEFYERVGALVSGAVTYEWILGHMERRRRLDLPGKPCWVLSSRDLPVPDGEDSGSSTARSPSSTTRCSPRLERATSGSSAAATSPRSSPTRGCSTS